ncbi:M23 family metallopeptidase [Sinomonas sp. ASV486]|uniref:M23 family metallopeptidase n=1 Tax=Sinomonas sp. ASV486 TaxID=3051170 RepID=UPI0027DE9ED4|nr:M23 family metallopeptidase [Sinomonas sp. ASV486]MDQ4489996.1 M23 family metallopeptidase [Sinomonas sp. ASV486]
MPRALAATISRLRARLSAGLTVAVAVSVFGAGPVLASDVFPFGPITADPGAVVPFYRTAVGSVAAGHVSAVLVAQANLHRPEAGKLYAPLTSLVPSSPFGYRINPLTGQVGEFHWGQDFAAGCGTPVYAADAGVVRAAGWHPWGGGNRVEIDHGNGLVTTYNHMLGAAVKVGESVEVGQVVGLVGSTGSSTGCHLHFETIKDGKYIDPMTFTFIALTQGTPLGTVQITDYSPKDGKSTNERQNWAIPALAQEPAPGETVVHAPAAPTPPPLVDPTPAGPPAAPPATSQVPAGGTTSTSSPSPTSSSSPSPASSPSPTPTASPTQTATATPTPTTTATATPTPTATATPTPTPTATSSSTQTTTAPAAAQTTTASPTSSSTATSSPTATPKPTS